MLIGNRIKLYMTSTCSQCHQSYQISLNDMLKECNSNNDSFIEVGCPECENTHKVAKETVYRELYINHIKIVKED